MADWDDIKRLAADLQKVQLSSTSQRSVLCTKKMHAKVLLLQIIREELCRNCVMADKTETNRLNIHDGWKGIHDPIVFAFRDKIGTLRRWRKSEFDRSSEYDRRRFESRDVTCQRDREEQ